MLPVRASCVTTNQSTAVQSHRCPSRATTVAVWESWENSSRGLSRAARQSLPRPMPFVLPPPALVRPTPAVVVGPDPLTSAHISPVRDKSLLARSRWELGSILILIVTSSLLIVVPARPPGPAAGARPATAPRERRPSCSRRWKRASRRLRPPGWKRGCWRRHYCHASCGITT